MIAHEEYAIGDKVMTPVGHAGEVCKVVGRNVDVRTINGTKTYNAAALTPIPRDAAPSQTDLATRSFRDSEVSQYQYGTKEYKWVSGGECIICHTPFEGLHLSVKTTCNDKCRQKLQRFRREVETDFERALDILSGYEDMILIPELKDKAREKLEQIRSLISEILEPGE